jgi:hypothetical protein
VRAALKGRPPCAPPPRSRPRQVKCRRANFNDGYGQWLERSNVCYNEQASVVVMVTDTCPVSGARRGAGKAAAAAAPRFGRRHVLRPKRDRAGKPHQV